MHVNISAVVAFKDDLSWSITVHTEVLVLSLSVPLDIDVHVVGSGLEVLELNESISERVRTHFLLSVGDDLKIIRV